MIEDYKRRRVEGRSKKGIKCREVVKSCELCGPTNCLLNLNIELLKPIPLFFGYCFRATPTMHTPYCRSLSPGVRVSL